MRAPAPELTRHPLESPPFAPEKRRGIELIPQEAGTRGFVRSFVVVVVFLSHLATVEAAILTVTTTSDSGAGSLRNTIAASQSGDTVTFAPDVRGTITLTSGEIAIPNTKTLSIVGPGADALTINADYRSRIINAAGYFNVSGLTFTKGYAQGGALYLGGYGGTVNNCIFKSNRSAPSTSGGAVYVDFGSWTFSNCEFLANISDGGDGGAVRTVENNGHKIEFSNCLFSRNIAARGTGGGLRTTYWTVISNTTFIGNVATEGGGVYMHSAFTGTDARQTSISASTFTKNTATKGGGGGLKVYVWASELDVNQCTFYGNKALIGGGVSGGVKLTNSTLTKNVAKGSFLSGVGGGIAGAPIMKSCIVAGNKANRGDRDVYGSVTSLGFNLVGVSKSGDGLESNGDRFGSARKPLNAGLGIFSNHGGPTATVALRAGSPAVDAGQSAFTSDQRGELRPIDLANVANAPVGGDGSDIGAFEAQ